MSTECSACGAYTESVSEGLKHFDDCPYIEIAELRAALHEANTRNLDVAALILDNDRSEAVKWATGLVTSFDGSQYQVRVDDAAPAAAKAVEMDAQLKARMPLSEEEIEELACKLGDKFVDSAGLACFDMTFQQVVDLARAIEAAHGISGESSRATNGVAVSGKTGDETRNDTENDA